MATFSAPAHALAVAQGQALRIGRAAEAVALRYLQSKGYQLKARNYRYQRGEIDLVMRAGRRLVFVEVKARNQAAFGAPEEAMNDKQRARIVDTAQAYIEAHGWHSDIRFDVVAIDHTQRCTHFRDAFY